MAPSHPANGLLGPLPDGHLVELAKFDAGAALDELDRRYAGLASRFAAAVTGRPADAAVVARDALDHVHSVFARGDAGVHEPFRVVLLRSVRAVALGRPQGPDTQQLAAALPADVDPETVLCLFTSVPEPERSALWLVEVGAFDEGSVASIFGESVESIRSRREAASSALGSRHEPAVYVLSSLSVAAGNGPASKGSARHSRKGRRAAVATSGPNGPRAQRPRRPGNEPLSPRLALLGAVVVLALAAFGAFFPAGSGNGSPLATLPAQDAPGRAPSPSTSTTDGSSAGRGRTASAADSGSPGTPATIDSAAKTAAPGTLPAVGPNGPSPTGATNRSPASTTAGQPSGGSAGTGSATAARPSASGTGGAQTAAPAGSASAAAGGRPSQVGSASAGTSRPAQNTSSPGTTAVPSTGSSAAAPPATTRPAVSTPAPSSPAPRQPLVPLISQVAGVVTSVVGGLLPPAGR